MKHFLLGLMCCSGVAFAQEQVNFSAKIANRNSDTLTISGKDFKHVIVAGKDGTFKDSFKVTNGFHQMSDGTESAGLYLLNGFDLNVTLDAKQFDETLGFSGKGANENNLLAQLTLINEQLGEEMKQLDKASFMKSVDEQFIGLQQILQNPALDNSFKAIMGMQLSGAVPMMEQMYTQRETVAKLKGQPSPGFDFENHKGGKTSLESMRGKYVYIDVWATWCAPCRVEIPHLKRIEEKYHNQKIEFVGVSIDAKKDHEKWKKFVTDQSLGGVQLFADSDWSSPFVTSYGINSIPRFLLIGPDGKVIDADAPRPSSGELEPLLDTLLK